MVNVTVRPGVDAENDFVADSFLRSYRSSSYVKTLPNDVYFPMFRMFLANMLASGYQVTVAADPADDAHVIGYAVSHARDPQRLAYLYVKQAFRGYGVGHRLVDAVGLDKSKPVVTPFWRPGMNELTHSLGIAEATYAPYEVMVTL